MQLQNYFTIPGVDMCFTMAASGNNNELYYIIINIYFYDAH